MTNHLRRVLLAKSVVDSGKVCSRVSNRPNTSRRAKTPVRKTERNAVRESLSENLINRLAYDTKHHPHEVANMSWGFGKRSSAKYNGRKKEIRPNSTDSSEDFSLRDHQGSLKSYGNKFGAGSGCRKANARSRGSSGGKKMFEDPADNSGESDDFGDVKKLRKSHRGEERKALKTFSSSIPRVTSSSEIWSPGTPEFATSNIDSDRYESDVSKYVKFVYDITKEVMDRGFYSDQEIERVFEKHFQRNLGRLKKNNMMREINSLKKAFNINYDSEDEEEEDPAAATSGFATSPKHSFAKLRSSRPTLKESTKILEKQVVVNREISLQFPSSKSKAEKIIDPPREIIVTREDILTTLLEMDFDPEKAQEICKSLQNRSKEVNLCKETELSTADKGEASVKNSGGKNIQLKALNGTDLNAKSNPPRRCEPTSSGVSSKPKKEDRSSPQLILTKEKIKDTRESTAESILGEGSGKVEEEARRIESEKNKIEGISENQSTKESLKALEERFSISNEDLKRSDSPSGHRSAVSSTGREINKVEANKSGNLNSGNESKLDNTAAAGDLNKKSERNDGAELDGYITAPESQESLIPQSSTKLADRSDPGVSFGQKKMVTLDPVKKPTPSESKGVVVC